MQDAALDAHAHILRMYVCVYVCMHVVRRCSWSRCRSVTPKGESPLGAAGCASVMELGGLVVGHVGRRPPRLDIDVLRPPQHDWGDAPRGLLKEETPPSAGLLGWGQSSLHKVRCGRGTLPEL